MFGFVAIRGAQVIFQYLFCIFNSIQGFLIFLFHVLREKLVRKSWRDLCWPRAATKSPHKAIKMSTSTSSDSSDSKAKKLQGELSPPMRHLSVDSFASDVFEAKRQPSSEFDQIIYHNYTYDNMVFRRDSSSSQY